MVQVQAFRCLFEGRVQGVYFRVQTRDKARELGLVGWVRNLPNGRVEAHVEGDPQIIHELLNWTRTSLRSGRVDELEHEVVEPEGFADFSIRH